MPTAFPNLIDGREVDSGDRAPDINPSNLHDVVGEFARGTPADACGPASSGSTPGTS